MTVRPCLLAIALVTLSVTGRAQAPVQPPAPASEGGNPISASHAKMYTLLSGVVVSAAEKMPEGNYAFKPAPDVRSFGQLVGHLADSQYYFCALAAGEQKPSSSAEKTKTSKTELVAALKEAVAYCTKAYSAMTDAKGAETVKLMNFDFARLTVLSANTAHDYEHYGNMSTYMRMKGIIPPTSEKTAAAEKK